MNHTAARHLSTILLTALPFTAAFAQATGGPANFEHQNSSSAVDTVRANERAQVGPYARWLMVNGMSADAAARAAKTIDHAQDAATLRYAKAR